MNEKTTRPSLTCGVQVVNAIIGGLIGTIAYIPITFSVVLPILKLISRATNAFIYDDGSGLGESMLWPLFLIVPTLVLGCFGILGGNIAYRRNHSRIANLVGVVVGGVSGSFILSIIIFFISG